MRSAILWTLAALAGLLVAAGVTLAASSLSSQRIGLSAEPPTAGRGLATRDAVRPKATSTPEHRRSSRRKQRDTSPRQRPSPTATPLPTAVPTATAERGDDHGGDGGGGGSRGRGGGGDHGGGHDD